MKHKLHKPKRENVHAALWNVAAVASIFAVVFRNDVLTVGGTTIAAVYHFVVIFFNEDLI